MDIVVTPQSGIRTFMRQEKFSMTFEFKDFFILEMYEELANNEFKRGFTIPDRFSEERVIGQSIDLPSSWRLRIKPDETWNHASVGLIFHRSLKRREYFPLNVYSKFQISIVDKAGDVLYFRKWRSWEHPRRWKEKDEHPMRDFISLENLSENQALFLPGNTLRVNCEGVLFSDFQHDLTSNYLEMLESAGPATIARKNKLWGDHQFADIALNFAAGEPLLAHSLILQDAGDYWRNLVIAANLARKPHDKYIFLSIDEFNREEVTKMLEFIYTGNFDQNWSELQEVLRLIQMAEKFELKTMKMLCLEKMANSMSITRFADVTLLFQSYSSGEYPRFQGLMQKFFLKNQSIILQQENFKLLAQTHRKAFLNVVLCCSQNSYGTFN